MNAIFVYGILKGRYANAQLARVRDYRLVDMGCFPAAIPYKDGVIVGELIFVSNGTVAEFDMAEGHPNFYRRTSVEVEVEEGDEIELVQAQMYVINEKHHYHISLPTGSLKIDLRDGVMTYEYC
jgi:gamma-glutamylcyclotransferase (GGCT)/AIG2-like uncharacterized protein YtfP